MSKYYFRFRIFLIAFALGLAGFWFVDGMSNGLVETYVEIPEAKSDSVIIVFPRYDCELRFFQGGGAAGGKVGKNLESRIRDSGHNVQMTIDECVRDFGSRGISYKPFR